MLRIALVLALATTAYADGILVKGDYPKVRVEVGKTVEQNVGYYRGYWGCDDTTLVTADLVTKGDSNFWIVTGVKAGSTQCRVGIWDQGGYAVFDVYVTDPPPPPKRPK